MLVSGDIPAHIGATALQMPHLAEHPAVRGKDAFNGLQRTVGVHIDIHSGISVQVHILGSHLAPADQVGNDLGRRYKAALAVGDGQGMQIAHLALG